MSEQSITIANDATIIQMIRGARRRLVLLAPAVSRPVAEALAQQWKSLGAAAVSIILDVHPEVYRLGYGELEAFTLLLETGQELGVTINCQAGIRIGLVIADDSTMVYSPTPLLIEAGPKRNDAPNAVLLGPPPATVCSDLGFGPGGAKDQKVGLDKPLPGQVENVKADLERNPPQAFDIARTVRVFNAYFEFVEFELVGTLIERRTAPIAADMMGLAKDERTQRLLKASFRLVDDTSNLSGKPLQRCKARLVSQYLTLLPGYGYVVLRAVKPEFERKVRQLGLAVRRFQERVRAELQTALDRNRASLVEALLPAVRQSPPKRWRKHFGTKADDSLLRRLLDEEVLSAFGSAEDLIKEMRVKVLFKGVTYESLKDPGFIRIAKEKLPALEQLYLEHDVAQAKQRTAS